MKPGHSGKKLLILLRDLLILIILGNTIAYFMNPGFRWELSTFLSNCAFSIAIGFPAWRGSILLSNILEKKLPWLKFPIKRLIAQITLLVLLVTLTLVLVIAGWVILSKDITFQNIREFAFSGVKIVVIFMLLSVIVTNGIIFFVNWREAAIQQEELKRAHLVLQYQSLKAQTNPHFLFNSLSSLVTLINSDPQKATDFVHRLSDVYRYVLDQGDNELVTVAEELTFLEDYIYLQKIRFGDNLEVSLNVTLDRNRQMVPLSLQMMVENAIKHNEVSAENPLVIELDSPGDTHIVIRNKLQKKEVIETSPGTGMDNLRKRIAFLTDEPLLVQEGSGVFQVTIPTISSEPTIP